MKSSLAGFVNGRVVPALTAFGDNPYLAAIRAGMVSIVPLTILGGLFMVVAFLPLPGWEGRMARWLPLLQVPVTATFGLIAVFACFAVAYDLESSSGRRPWSARPWPPSCS